MNLSRVLGEIAFGYSLLKLLNVGAVRDQESEQ